jgi:hypothetical protein
MIRRSIQFEDLCITPADVAALPGFEPDVIPDPFRSVLEDFFREAPDILRITAGYRVFHDPLMDIRKGAVVLDNVSIHPGPLALSELDQCASVVLFILTAGNAIGSRISELSGTGNLAGSYVYDLLGSLVAMRAVDRLLTLVMNEPEFDGCQVTTPCFPGNCGWDISEQKKIFSLFPENCCGVTLSGNFMMTPVKSLSGMAGIGTGFPERKTACEGCNDRYCVYRKMR